MVTQFGWREKPSYVCGLQGCFWGAEGSESAPALLKTSVPTLSALQLVKGVKKDEETFVAHHLLNPLFSGDRGSPLYSEA